MNSQATAYINNAAQPEVRVIYLKKKKKNTEEKRNEEE